jgi:HlyD family secretion protein
VLIFEVWVAMRFFKLSLITLLISSAIALPIYYFFFLTTSAPLDKLYDVESPAEKDIKQIISATGALKLKDQVKVGSVVTGRVKAIFVSENDVVEEGQLLIEIDTGLGDTEVREAQGAYEKALAELEYQETNYQRQIKLFEGQLISDATLQEAKRSYRTTVADVKALGASYDKNVIIYQNNKVYAPASGIIIHINVAKGEKVSSDLEGGTLLSLAPDVKLIEAELDISEKDIGQIQKDQKVLMVVDTYPNKVFESKIQNISFTSKEDEEKECTYQAKAYLDNPNLFLRPGMSVNATIHVSSVDASLALTSRPFIIKQDHLQSIAKLLNYKVQSLKEDDKEKLSKEQPDKHIQFVWVVCENCFQEVPVEIGVTDNIYFQIKSGLKGDEKIVADVLEDDEMQKIYEKFYRKF